MNRLATELTPRQQQVFDIIKQGVDSGLPPTRAELAEALGVRLNAVQDFLRILVRKGYIELIPAIARGIRVTRTEV